MGPCLCGDPECRRCFPNQNYCETCDGSGEVDNEDEYTGDGLCPQMECPDCDGTGYKEEKDLGQDDPHEREAARARGNDFEETGGKDWT